MLSRCAWCFAPGASPGGFAPGSRRKASACGVSICRAAWSALLFPPGRYRRHKPFRASLIVILISSHVSIYNNSILHSILRSFLFRRISSVHNFMLLSGCIFRRCFRSPGGLFPGLCRACSLRACRAAAARFCPEGWCWGKPQAAGRGVSPAGRTRPAFCVSCSSPAGVLLVLTRSFASRSGSQRRHRCLLTPEWRFLCPGRRCAPSGAFAAAIWRRRS